MSAPALPVAPFASLPGLWTGFSQVRAVGPVLQEPGRRGDCRPQRVLRWGSLATISATNTVEAAAVGVGCPRPPPQQHPPFTPGTRRRAGGPAASSGEQPEPGRGREAPRDCPQERRGPAEPQSRAPNTFIFQRRDGLSPSSAQASRPLRPTDHRQAQLGQPVY